MTDHQKMSPSNDASCQATVTVYSPLWHYVAAEPVRVPHHWSQLNQNLLQSQSQRLGYFILSTAFLTWNPPVYIVWTSPTWNMTHWGSLLVSDMTVATWCLEWSITHSSHWEETRMGKRKGEIPMVGYGLCDWLVLPWHHHGQLVRRRPNWTCQDQTSKSPFIMFPLIKSGPHYHSSDNKAR